MLFLGLIFSALLVVTSQQYAGLRRVCYYTNWSQYRPNAGKFVPENVDPKLCTHYIYAFATLQGNGIRAFEWNDESTQWSKGMYERFMALKQQNPSMKVLLAVGGWNMGSGPFTSMVATPQSRAQFIQSAIAFLRKNNFDGLDVDWEYPANRGSPPADKANFAALAQEMRAAFEAEARTSGKPRLLVTAAVGAGKDKIDTAYDIPTLNRYLDFINLMTYDLHGSWETFTGHQTALYPRASETGDQRYLNVDFAARYWVQNGASPSKLNIGVATYGRTFTVVNPAQNGLGDAARQAGNAGQFTRENGFLAYYEMCQMKQRGGQVHQDQEQSVRYLTNGDQWVGGEDQQTMAQKVCYIKQHGYGGVMVWALDLDDFTGTMCGQGPYPLLHTINNELNDPSFRNCPNPSAPVQQQQTIGIPVFGTTQPPYFTFAPVQGHVTAQPPYVPGTTRGQYVPPGNLNPTQGVYNPYTPAATQPPFNPTFAVFWNTLNPRVTQPTRAPYVPIQTQKPYVPVQTQPPYVPVQTQPPYQTQTPAVTGGSGNPLQHVTQRGFNCMHLPSDFYPNAYACDEYYICANQVSFRVRCAAGLQFNPVSKHCDWPNNVHCVTLHTNPLNPQQPVYTHPPITTQRPFIYTQAPAFTLPPLPTQAPVQTQVHPVYTLPPLQTQFPPVYTQAPAGQLSATAFCAQRPYGAYRNPADCKRFYKCSGQGTGTQGTCPNSLVFNVAFALCTDQYYVPSCRTLMYNQHTP